MAAHIPSSDWLRRCARAGGEGGDWPAGRGRARFPGRRAGPGAAMASVHESLYFNPMLTNGVVHANVFGVRDWVTPHKMALLVLLSELGRAGPQLGLLERRRLNRLLLPLLQVGPGTGAGPGGRAAPVCRGLSRHVAVLRRVPIWRCRGCARPSRSAARPWPAPSTSGAGPGGRGGAGAPGDPLRCSCPLQRGEVPRKLQMQAQKTPLGPKLYLDKFRTCHN